MDNLKMLSPVWNIVGPRIQRKVTDESAGRAADYLNRSDGGNV